VSLSDIITTTLDQALAVAESVLGAFGQGAISLVRFVFGVVTGIVFACLDTTLEMVLGGLGATTGAALGLALIHGTLVDDHLANWMASQQWLLFPQLQITEWRGMLMFAIAGWSTAWGLTLAGGFGQERRFIVSGITGIFGFTITWFIWQASGTVALPERLLGLVTAVGVVPLVLGLGLPSHYLVHAFVAALGTGTLFGGLVWLNVLNAASVIDIFSHSDKFIDTIAFFGLWGVILAFWVGVSYYILVPVLRWLGWR
jgi:hypothetical protein